MRNKLAFLLSSLLLILTFISGEIFPEISVDCRRICTSLSENCGSEFTYEMGGIESCVLECRDEIMPDLLRYNIDVQALLDEMENAQSCTEASTAFITALMRMETIQEQNMYNEISECSGFCDTLYDVCGNELIIEGVTPDICIIQCRDELIPTLNQINVDISYLIENIENAESCQQAMDIIVDITISLYTEHGTELLGQSDECTAFCNSMMQVCGQDFESGNINIEECRSDCGRLYNQCINNDIDFMSIITSINEAQDCSQANAVIFDAIIRGSE